MSEQRPEDVTPHVCDSPHLDLCTRPGHKEILTPTTPRVAESLDDLAVGMVVAWKMRNREWSVHVVKEQRPGGGFWTNKGAGLTAAIFAVDHVVILSAPPAPDWLVPADTMETLSRMIGLMDANTAYTDFRYLGKIVAAARAVLDAATEVE